jgi:hypothetical protein
VGHGRKDWPLVSQLYDGIVSFPYVKLDVTCEEGTPQAIRIRGGAIEAKQQERLCPLPDYLSRAP